jgi:hypothetical protein
MKKTLLIALFIAGSVFSAYAQITIGGGGGSLSGGNNALLNLLNLAQTIVSRLIPFAIGLAVLAFFWFLITFIVKGQDDPKKQQESLAGMGYSILAIFVMVSIWGIIGFFGSIFGIGQGGSMPAFKLPGER